ncbi:MAG: hypothetical protein JW950_08990 [Deltaproteobacteria bacterium]|nr:hypothetical protein [Deltaproteobacteria bacterium]
MSNGGANRSILCIIIFLIFGGCAHQIPKEALQLTPESLKNRQLQTRFFDTDEKTLLSASAAVLQDLGFTVDESEVVLGVIVSSKQRTATSPGQIVGAVIVAALTGVLMPVDKSQLIRASLVTHPIIVDVDDKAKCKTAVRVTFQRIVTNIQNQVSRSECIIDEAIYQEFFDKLSQSLFLEAHNI